MPDQFDLFGGRKDRDEGMARADRDPEWSSAAYETIVRLARRQPEVHVDDVLRGFSMAPPHFNSWGMVWQRAIRAGILVKTGRMRPTADRKKHAHQYPVYGSLLFRG